MIAATRVPVTCIRVNVIAIRCIGSLLSMVESHVLMVAEVFRHDQTLPRKSGSWPTRGLFHELRRSLWCSLPTPRFQALPGGVAAACRAQQDAHCHSQYRAGCGST